MTPVNPKERRPDGAAFAIAAFLAGFGALLVWDSARIANTAGYAGIGPADFPRLIGICLLGLAVWTVIAGLRSTGEEKVDHRPLPVLLILLGLGLQLLLVRSLGFSVGSGLLFACTAAAFGYRKWWIMLPAGVGLAFFVYVVFDRLLQLNLPHGPFETLILGS